MTRTPSLIVANSVQPACETPCSECPWRKSNQGKKHPDGWYTKKNLRSLWTRLRRGERMSCHPTDPTNPVTEKALAAGVKPAREGAITRECAGALVLVQREIMYAQDYVGQDRRAYYRNHPEGLTQLGLRVLFERELFGRAMGDIMTHVNLNEPDVGVPWLKEWTARMAEVKDPLRDAEIHVVNRKRPVRVSDAGE